MGKDGKLKRIKVRRNDTPATVRTKILGAYTVVKFDYHYLECFCYGSKLILSSNQVMNGKDAVDRRGCLYICKKPQVRTSYTFS